MGQLAQIFGYDKRGLWWYRDLALTTMAGIMSLWVIIALMGPESSPFTRWLSMGAATIAVLCWIITPNRWLLFGAVVGVVAVQGWFAVLFSNYPRSWWIAIPATIVGTGFFLKYRNRRLIQR
jgi:hypothetical protein